AAVSARGTTTLRNAACAPHGQALRGCLASLGAEVQGVGTNTLTVEGGRPLRGAAFALGPDHIEIGSFIGLAAVTNGAITIEGVRGDDLRATLLAFERLGVRPRLDGTPPGVVESPDIRAGMAMLLAALAAQGDSVIHNIGQIDRGYERIDDRLRGLGAQVERLEGQPDSRTARR